jgi:two-component system sensor histidine kinase ChvG
MSLASRVAAALSRVRTSKIGLRVLAFNLLVLFLPVAGILYLDLYELHLLESQERGMVEQARLLAATLGGGDSLTADMAASPLTRLRVEGDSRFRVFDAQGRLLADSRRLLGAPVSDDVGRYATATGRDSLLYKLGTWLVRVKRTVLSRSSGDSRPSSDAGEARPDDVPSEVRTALSGRYGAASRPTPGQRSLTLSAALPIHSGDRILGAVVVSQSTWRVLQALYTVRLRTFEVVLASAAVAALLSALMSATIVRPLVRLRRAASSLAERRTPLTGTFAVVDRRDEIGDLARSLEELATRLDAQIRLLESFAADVSHEFKNPLASIRMAAEMLVGAQDAGDRERFFAMLARDVDRLERLVSGVRELAKIDAQLAHEPAATVDVTALLAELVEGLRSCGAWVSLQGGATPIIVRASRDHLLQVFDNLLQNARSFAPDGEIQITVDRTDSRCRFSVSDKGPGIPAAHLGRVFDRFFTYRPHEAGARREHMGLGLSIARTIVEGYGGQITASNGSTGGATFVVDLPRSGRPSPRSGEASKASVQLATGADSQELKVEKL